MVMPLDPFFAERLRTHRRYLIGQAWGALRIRLRALRPFAAPATADVAGKSVPGAAAAATATAAAAEPAKKGARLSPGARARAKHRASARAWDRKELAAIGTPGPGIRTTEHTLEPPDLPPFRVRIYWPGAEGAAGAVAGPPPACLAFYGGAFRIGGIDYPTTDAGYRRRAADSGVAIVAVDYALAPEHRYPVAVEQAYAALDWIVASAADLGLDRDRIGLMGTSAGGCIAAALTLINRDRAQHPIRLQVLEVPVVDLTGGHIDLGATRALGIPSIIALRELNSVARTYLPNRRAAREPYASPIRAESLAGLPPAVVLTAEYDPLRGDGAAYAAALREAGVEASAVRYLGVTHDIPMFTGALDAARRWHDDIVSALRRLHR
jgi:acetyl esterase